MVNQPLVASGTCRRCWIVVKMPILSFRIGAAFSSRSEHLKSKPTSMKSTRSPVYGWYLGMADVDQDITEVSKIGIDIACAIARVPRIRHLVLVLDLSPMRSLGMDLQAFWHLENYPFALSGHELSDIVKMKIVHRAPLFRKRSTH